MVCGNTVVIKFVIVVFYFNLFADEKTYSSLKLQLQLIDPETIPLQVLCNDYCECWPYARKSNIKGLLLSDIALPSCCICSTLIKILAILIPRHNPDIRFSRFPISTVCLLSVINYTFPYERHGAKYPSDCTPFVCQN